MTIRDSFKYNGRDHSIKTEVWESLLKTTSLDTAKIVKLYLAKFKAHLDIKDIDYFKSSDFIDFIDSLNYNPIFGYEYLTSAEFWQKQCSEV
jgi:hypothetical protein